MRKVININKKWAFTKDADSAPVSMPEKWYFVNLPHTWNAIDGQDGGSDYYRGTCWYAKEIELTQLPKADEYFIEINGCGNSGDVYLNGEHLAHHDGGYSTWRHEITEYLKPGKNLFVISADNGANDHVYPQKADFTFYGGLYRDVNIIAVSSSHFDLEYYGGPGIMVTPSVNGADAEVEVKVFIKNPRASQELKYIIRDQEGMHVAERVLPVSETSTSFTIQDAHLWNGRKDPYLYTMLVSLTDHGEELDEVSTRFGCRSYRIDPDLGFILNGSPYPLRGVSRHQDWKGIGNALLPCHHEKDMELICEMGATTIRLAHYQHAQYFYDLCDENGLVVWAEIPYISAHLENGRENTISQMKELIIQNYNHPSIVVWGLSNEITMNGASDTSLIENHEALNDLAHTLDPTRPTTLAILSSCDMHEPYLQIPDCVSWNLYYGWYGGDTSMNGEALDRFHAEFPDIPVGMSEYGCEALNWHSSDPKQGDYTEEYQAHYHEELIKQLYSRPYIWATHVWNMFDFAADSRNEGGENGMNHKGLVTFDREYKKDAFYAYKAWLSDDPFVHICGKRYVDRVEDVTKITVYSNQPEVELFLGEKSLGKKASSDHFFYFDVPNEGESSLTAVAGNCTDRSRLRKVDTFNESYRLTEEGAVLNWFDITEPDGYLSLNSTIGEVISTNEGSEFFKAFLSDILSNAGVTQKTLLSEDTLRLMSSFTILRLTSMAGTMGIPQFTREQLLELNAKLNSIKCQ